MATCALWQFESIPGVEDRDLIGTSTLLGTGDRQAAPVHVLAACPETTVSP